MGGATSGREDVGESYAAAPVSSRSGQSQQKRHSSWTQGVDLAGAVSDHNGYQTTTTVTSRSTPQLQTLSAAGGHKSAVSGIDNNSSVGASRSWYDVASTDSTATSTSTGTVGNFDGVSHRQQAQQVQQSHRQLYQAQPTTTTVVPDRSRYGQSFTGEAGGSDDHSSSTPGIERVNTGAGRGLESGGSNARNGPPTHVRRSSAAAFAFSAVDARPLTSSGNAYSAAPLHARSRSDGRYDRERVALASRTSVSNMIGLSASQKSHLGRRELLSQCGQVPHSSHGQQQQHHHNFGNGRWRGAGAVDSTSVAGGSGYHGAGLPSHPEQLLTRVTRSSPQYPSATSAITSSCRGFDVTRRSASHQVDRRFPSGTAGGDASSGSSASSTFNSGTSSRAMIESPPLAVNEQRRLAGVPHVNPPEAFSLSPADYGGAGIGELTPVDPITLVVDRNTSPDIIANTHPACCNHVATAAGGQAGCCVSPPAAAPGVLPKPKNPFEWLQRLQQSRGGKEKCPTTPRTSRSSSMSSLASPARLAALMGGAPAAAAGDGSSRACGGGHQRSDSMAATRGGVVYGAGVCPAPDCPGNGDCLPGATPDMLVYEVKFKRATRTFLLGDAMDHGSTCCGDRVKVCFTCFADNTMYPFICCMCTTGNSY